MTLTHSIQVVPEALVGCEQSVGMQRVGEHWGVPLMQVQIRQGLSGCHLEPSSYSSPSSTQATRRQERDLYAQLHLCVHVSLYLCRLDSRYVDL